MRYAYAITGVLLAGGTAATLAMQQPLSAQVAQNAPGTLPAAAAPRPGAPMSFADLAAKLQPAVVNISTTQKIKVAASPFAGTPFEQFFHQFNGGGDDDGDSGSGSGRTREATSLGSGFIISPDGYIVTNNHVISGGQPTATNVVSSIKVTMTDGKEYDAKVIGRDLASDLALLKIDATKLPFVQFGDSTHARVGDWVIAIGEPYGLGGTVTAGIISALHRSITGGGAYDRYLQTDAAINQGNSGGPMFDLNGNVIGINNAIYSPTGGNVGIGFAIPADQAKPVIQALMHGGKVTRGYLGVGIQPMSDEIASSLGLPPNRGEIVSRIEPGGAAARAGLRQGDVVVKVNGTEVTPDNSLSYLVANLQVGSRVPIEVVRAGKHVTVTAVVAERPPEDKLAAETGTFGSDDSDSDSPTQQGDAQKAARTQLGLSLQPLTADVARQLGMASTVRGVVIGSSRPVEQRRKLRAAAWRRDPLDQPASDADRAGCARRRGRGEESRARAAC